jgi:hypothetical protein
MKKLLFIKIIGVSAMTPRMSKKNTPYSACDITFSLEGSIGKHTFSSFTSDQWVVGQLGQQVPVEGSTYFTYNSLLSPTEIKEAKATFVQAHTDYAGLLD